MTIQFKILEEGKLNTKFIEVLNEHFEVNPEDSLHSIFQRVDNGRFVAVIEYEKE